MLFSYNIKVSFWCAQPLTRSWPRKMQQHFKTCSVCRASSRGWSQRWKVNLAETPMSWWRSWRCGNLGTLAGSKWTKTAAFQHVPCWGVRVMWIWNSALLSNYNFFFNIIGIPRLSGLSFPHLQTLGFVQWNSKSALLWHHSMANPKMQCFLLVH